MLPEPEVFQKIDSITVSLGGGAGTWALNIILAFVMFGVALGIKPRTFVDVFKKPKSVITGLCCQLILLPALTFCLTLLLGRHISWSMAMGMILVASCPGGNISNFISSLSKANVELSVSLTAVTTALSVLLTPFNFWAWGNLYLHWANRMGEVPYFIDKFPIGQILVTIFVLLGIPLTLGILCSQYLPKLADKLKKPLQWISVAFFVLMVVAIFCSNMKAFVQCIQYIFFIVLIHNLLALLIGFCTASSLKLPAKDRRTITIETGIQNSGLGLALMLGTDVFTSVFGNPLPGGMLVITAWWGVWHIISGLTVAGLFNLGDRKKKKEI